MPKYDILQIWFHLKPFEIVHVQLSNEWWKWLIVKLNFNDLVDEELKVLDDHLFAGGVPADDGVGGGVVDDGEEL